MLQNEKTKTNLMLDDIKQTINLIEGQNQVLDHITSVLLQLIKNSTDEVLKRKVREFIINNN